MTSFLSKEVLNVDIPDPVDVNAEFSYVYYTPDETLIGSNLLREKARFVTITFKAPVPDKSENLSIDFESLTDLQFIDLRDRGLINPEYAVTTPGMTQLTIEDTDLGRRLQDVTMRKLRNLFPGVEIETANLSQTDLANALNNATSNSVKREIILDLVSDFASDGFTFYDRNDKEIKDEVFVNAASVKFETQFNEKFSGDLYRLMSLSPLSSNQKGAILNADSEIARQDNYRRTTSAVLSAEDYIPDICFVGAPKLTQSHSAVPKFVMSGHVIDRHTIDEFGDRIPESSRMYFVSNMMGKKYVDYDVLYGETYSYEIRTLAKVTMTVGGDVIEDVLASGNSPNSIYEVTFYITSRASKQAKVKCIDKKPPPPPALLNFRYDFDLNCLAIKWDFPHTEQQDIKKFQIFKRRTIFEPFILIAQYDFTDALSPVAEIEDIDPVLNHEMTFGRRIYLDEDFDKSGDAIYAIVSVDAHHLTSNYSDQIRVKFNRSKNAIETKLISPAGAPKQYPNFFVSTTSAQNIETVRYTEDVIRDSSHLTMRVFFDPETIDIEDHNFLCRSSESKNTSILNQGSYKFQIINIDRQKDAVIDIVLNDIRNS